MLLGWILGILVVSSLAWLEGRTARWTTLKRFGVAMVLVVLAEGYTHVTSPQGIPDQPAVTSLPSPGMESVSTRFSPSQVSSGLGGRVADAKPALPIIRENLLLGVGAGNYPLARRARLTPESVGIGYVPVHNVPLLATAELGVAGGLAWVLMMVGPLIWVLSNRSPPRFGFHSLLWLGPLLVLLFVGLWEFTPWATQDGRVLMMAVAGLWAGGITGASLSSVGSQSDFP